MWNVELAACHRVPHHIPSLNQSLLSGFDPLGAAPAPAKDGPGTPISPVSADVAAGRSDSNSAAKMKATIPRRRGARDGAAVMLPPMRLPIVSGAGYVLRNDDR
jgi:hypothetical protein